MIGQLQAMGDAAPKLIFVGGAGSLEVRPDVTYADSMPGVVRMVMPRSLKQEIDGQVLTLQYLQTIEDVDWAYVSPAKDFKPGERTGVFRIGGDQMLLDSDGNSAISMEDFAVALINEAERPQFSRERFSVAY
jgi:hypothetical protein